MNLYIFKTYPSVKTLTRSLLKVKIKSGSPLVMMLAPSDSHELNHGLTAQIMLIEKNINHSVYYIIVSKNV